MADLIAFAFIALLLVGGYCLGKFIEGVLHAPQEAEARFEYTNWKGETSTRRVVPYLVWFGSTEWHPQEQWLLHAYDLDKEEERDFALADIKAWWRSGVIDGSQTRGTFGPSS